MKKIITCILAVLLFLTAGLTSYAADAQENRALGYFDNTRTVLLLPARYGNGDEAAAYVNQEMKNIFRYPYYRTLDTSQFLGDAIAPSDLPGAAEKADADIVVMPVITRWQQWVFHRSLFWDSDDIVETHARIDIYTYRKGDEAVRDDKAEYNDREDESFVRNEYIFDTMMKRIYKTFPFRRVPTDMPKNLDGGVDKTPAAVMKN